MLGLRITARPDIARDARNLTAAAETACTHAQRRHLHVALRAFAHGRVVHVTYAKENGEEREAYAMAGYTRYSRAGDLRIVYWEPALGEWRSCRVDRMLSALTARQ